MRIKLKNSRELFEEIDNKENLNLKELSKKLKINYSTIKKYRRGELAIPKKIFEKLIELSSNKENWLKNSEILENNWGASKGGKISALKDKLNMRIEYARKFKKIRQINIKIDEFFCEFYGALMGDGCISRFKDWNNQERFVIYFSGNKKLDSDYLRYLQKEISSRFKTYVYYYNYKNRNLCFLSIKNKGISLFLHELGFPIGVKYGKLKIPKRILKLPWKMQKMLIRGLFDTDGSICAKKREGYKYPQICISLKDKIVIKQLYNMLRNRGYPCWIGGDNIFIRGKGCVKRWMLDIGSSNERNLFKYNYWLKNRIMPKNLGP
jgi:intein/homing endonuclease